ncbi:hypothetical protein DRQ53_04450 [bacterium]|nr:MAG: hypothetical protein DRQ32_08235 [bacterium]RKZ17085.1 MAG: hypothetical protein DRQ53_04450 [bacterium]
MTESGRAPNWRHRVMLMGIALMGTVLMLPLSWIDADAQASTELTILYHGSVGGKIAPCG